MCVYDGQAYFLKKVKFEEIKNGLNVFIPNKFKIPERMPEKFKNVQFLSSVKESRIFELENFADDRAELKKQM